MGNDFDRWSILLRHQSDALQKCHEKDRPTLIRSEQVTDSSQTRRKPLWKRAAKSVRSAAHRGVTVLDRLAPWRMTRSCHRLIFASTTTAPGSQMLLRNACRGARNELEVAGLRSNHRVLDIGSGIGNLAVSLIGYLQGTYDGVEVHEEAVAWCRRAITPHHPTFRFHHADLTSGAYNPGCEHAQAAGYRFPFPDRSFDVIFLGSVYTHPARRHCALRAGGCPVARTRWFLRGELLPLRRRAPGIDRRPPQFHSFSSRAFFGSVSTP